MSCLGVFGLGKFADLVVLDDDELFTYSLASFAAEQLIIDYYHDPQKFKDNIILYPRSTEIIIDYHFYGLANCELNGIHIAQWLISLGFMKLCIMSGEKVSNLPAGLDFMLKSDMQSIKRLIGIK